MELNINLKMIKEVGIVVPTLGNRENYLVESLKSIESAGCKNVILVGPVNKLSNLKSISGLYTHIINDPGIGLPNSINLGIQTFPKEIKYVGWLGDDDLLTKNSLIASLKVFALETNVVATYGACIYIDEMGKEIFLNRSGQWASKFMNCLPNLIPQPGSLYLRTTYEFVGGVKSTHPLSFDFELFFNLRKFGEVRYIPNIQACFRWHPSSLSVGQRNLAILQTSKVRKAFLPYPLRVISFLWEPIIIIGTKVIGILLQIKLKIKK